MAYVQSWKTTGAWDYREPSTFEFWVGTPDPHLPGLFTTTHSTSATGGVSGRLKLPSHRNATQHDARQRMLMYAKYMQEMADATRLLLTYR